MLTKKYSVPLALGDRVQFTVAGSEKKFPVLTLSKLDMREGYLTWEMLSDTGHVFAGNAQSQIELPFFGKERATCWVKPSMPIVLHVRNGECVIDLMFCIPASAFVNAERRKLTQKG